MKLNYSIRSNERCTTNQNLAHGYNVVSNSRKVTAVIAPYVDPSIVFPSKVVVPTCAVVFVVIVWDVVIVRKVLRVKLRSDHWHERYLLRRNECGG